MVSASVLAALDDRVDELQLVAGVALWELGLDLLIEVEQVFDGLNVHPGAAQDLASWNDLAGDFTSLVEDEGWAVLVLEVLDGLGRDRLDELGLWVLDGELGEELVQESALDDTTRNKVIRNLSRIRHENAAYVHLGN